MVVKLPFVLHEKLLFMLNYTVIKQCENEEERKQSS